MRQLFSWRPHVPLQGKSFVPDTNYPPLLLNARDSGKAHSNFLSNLNPITYCSSLAASTQNIYFHKMLKSSKRLFPNNKLFLYFVKENRQCFRIFWNYSTLKCWTCRGTTVNPGRNFRHWWCWTPTKYWKVMGLWFLQVHN
jgi:hypothetical protein